MMEEKEINSSPDAAENKGESGIQNQNDAAHIVDIKNEVKGLKKLLDRLFKGKEEVETTTSPEAPINISTPADYEKLFKEKDAAIKALQSKIEVLENARESDVKQRTDTKISNAITRAKENGFIPTDDKDEEEWLRKVLLVDFEGSLKKIDNHKKITKKAPVKLDEETAKSATKQSARKAVRKYF
jgi:hypothetical protein